MAKMQEEMNQHAHAANPIPSINPPVIETLILPPQSNTLVHILVDTSGSVPSPILNTPVIEIDDQQDAFFSPKRRLYVRSFWSLDQRSGVEIKVQRGEAKSDGKYQHFSSRCC